MKTYFLFSLIFFVSCSGIKKSSMDVNPSSNPVIAHRGAFKKKGFPENSIASLREAIRLQCAGSEFDVRMTADDSLVINHDPDHGKMDIEKTSYDTLIKVSLANGEPFPTLRQYLHAGMANNSRTLLILEIKPSPSGKGRLLAEKCVSMVKEMGAAAITRYISFDYDILKRVRAVNPEAHTQYLNGDKSPDELKADGISGADYHVSVFQKKPEWIESAKRNDIVLNAWTVNSENDMRWLIGKGFDYITTNEPELLFDVIRSTTRLK
jgi:glycerophosphoryl diester phosphodiesterase